MTEGQRYFEDVTAGEEITPLGPTTWDTPDIVRFTGAVENYEHLHHDRKWTREHGFPDTLVNGPIKNALLSIMLTDWIGPGGFLKKLSCQHRGMDVPMDELAVTGTITDAYVGDDGLGYVECDVRVANQKGEVTCPGRATVILPRREGPPVPLAFPESG